MLPEDSIAALNFRLQLLDSSGASVDDGSFQEVTGLSTKMETEDYREGGENRFAHRLPTGVKHEPLKLSRGVLLTDGPLAHWCREILEGNFAQPVQPKTVLLQLVQGDALLKAWLLQRAWPLKWEVAGFASTEGKLVVEILELAYDSFELLPNPAIK